MVSVGKIADAENILAGGLFVIGDVLDDVALALKALGL